MKCLSLFDACVPLWVLARVQSPLIEWLTIWNRYWLEFTCVCCLFALGMTVLWTRLVNLPILGSTSQGLITSSSSLKVMWIFRLFLMNVSSLGMPIIDIRLFWAVLNSVRLSSSFSVSGRPSNPPSASVPVGNVTTHICSSKHYVIIEVVIDLLDTCLLQFVHNRFVSRLRPLSHNIPFEWLMRKGMNSPVQTFL